MKTHYVYVIGAKDGPFKIGRTGSLEDRRRELQVGYPVPIRVVHSLECESTARASGVEKTAHRLLRRKRASGEWFFVTQGQAAAAVQLANAICRNLERAAADEDYVGTYSSGGRTPPPVELLIAVEFGECRGPAKKRVRMHGKRAFDKGGIEAMQKLYRKVERLSVTKRAWHVSEVWDGIGGWEHGRTQA